MEQPTINNTLGNGIFLLGFSAFAGAFFAYLFTRIADFFSRVYQRKLKHYNSLAELEIQLNEIGGIINDDIYIIPEFVRVITLGQIYFNNLRPLPIDKSHYGKLNDINLINKLFSYNYDLRKINDDIETITRGYDKIETAYTQHNITSPEYKNNCESMGSQLVVLKSFLIKTQNKTKGLIVQVRLQADVDKPLGVKIQGMLTKSNGSKITKAEVKKEMKKLNKEINETKRSSRKEIKSVLKEAGLLK